MPSIFNAHLNTQELQILHHTSRGMKFLRVAGSILLGIYLLLIACIVFWPVHVDDNTGGELVREFLRNGHQNGWLPLWFSYKTVEWLSNVLMFTPGGLLLTLLIPWRKRTWVPLIAFATTCFIEFTQLFMPGRTSSIWDIAANTLGGTIGWLIAIVIQWVFLKNSRWLKSRNTTNNHTASRV